MFGLWGIGLSIRRPDVDAVVDSFEPGVIFVRLKLPAPDDAERSFVLPSLQSDDLTRKKFGAQPAKAAADLRGVDRMRQVCGRFGAKILQPHA